MEPKDLKILLQEMQSNRGMWEDHWQDLRDYILPYRQGFTTTITAGDKTMQYCTDGTGPYALMRMAQGLRGLYTSEAIPWFRMGLEEEQWEEDWEVKGWLEALEAKFYSVFAKTNFYSQLTECYLDLSGFGTSVLYAERFGAKIRYKALPLNQCYLMDDFDGTVNILARKMTLTARQVKSMWPDSLGTKVQKALDAKKWLDTFTVCHFVYPRKNRNIRSLHAKQMPFASVYFDPDDLHVFHESGYHEFPFAVARCQVMDGECYGRGYGMMTLPDVKMLNQMEGDILRAGAKRIDPPLLMTSDALLSPLSFRPAGISIINASTLADKIMPLPLGGDLGYGDQKADQKRFAIKQMFFNDLFETVAAPGETATAALKRIQKQLQMIGSLLSQIEGEIINPIFDRTFALLLEMGEIPPPPQVLMGRSIKIDYISPLAKAQRSVEAEGIMAVTQYISQVGQIFPEAMDIIDFGEASRVLADVYGLKTKLIRPPEVVAEIQQAKQQAAQQQQMAQMAMEAAKAAPGLGKVIEPGSPMGLLTAQLEAGNA